jgi:hypothetical protein
VYTTIHGKKMQNITKIWPKSVPTPQKYEHKVVQHHKVQENEVTYKKIKLRTRQWSYVQENEVSTWQWSYVQENEVTYKT